MKVFWRNVRQSYEEREDLKEKLTLLLKIKRAICENIDFDLKRLVIDKISKKIFNNNESNIDMRVIYRMTMEREFLRM